jgi:hypothetical protein
MAGRTLFAFVLLVPAHPSTPAPPAEPPARSRLNLGGGVVVDLSPLEYAVSRRGVIEAKGRVWAYGGSGDVEARTGLGLDKEVDVRLKDVDVAEVAALLGDELPAWLKPKLKGKIGVVTIAVRGDRLTLAATGFRIPGDPVARLDLEADLKTRKFTAKIKALGGLAIVAGELPKPKD